MYNEPAGHTDTYSVTRIQRVILGLMSVLVCLTFIGANVQALLWQSSDWLVSTVLPAVVVDLTNDERAALAETPLRRNAVLDQAARLKAEHMAKNEYFSHYSPDGVSPWYWFGEAGYVYAHAGENLAIHFTDSADVVEAWMNSPTHRDNIVDSRYREIGVGTAKGSYQGFETVYVVQLFGTPAIAPPPAVAEPEPEVVAVPEPEPVVAVATAPQVAGTQEIEPPVQTTSFPIETPTPEEVERSSVPQDLVVDTQMTEEPQLRTQPQAESTPVEVPEPVFVEAVPEALKEVVVVTRPLIATSSGLAIANIEETNSGHAGATIASIATRPHQVLQWLYVAVGLLTLSLIAWSLVHEARRLHFVQVAYSLLLLVVMGGLWFVHELLTAGAVVA